MNKNRKRAISRGKFDRIAANPDCIYVKRGLLWHYIVAYNRFFYWRELDIVNSQYKYFRKSISEALK